MIVVEPNADAGTRPSRTITATGAVHVHHHFAVPVVVEKHDEIIINNNIMTLVRVKTIWALEIIAATMGCGHR